MKLLILFTAILLVLMSPGCQTVYPVCEQYETDTDEMAECNKDQREWRRGIDKENYNLCAATLENHPKYWMLHKNHIHGPRNRVYSHDIQDDLALNGCRELLGDAWANY